MNPSQSRSTSKFVIIRSPIFLQQLSKILSHTPSNVIEAFFVWKAIQEYAPRIEDPKLKPLKQFQNKLGGRLTETSEERWKQCVRDVGQEVSWILSKFYIKQKFPAEAKDLGNQIIANVRNALVDLLQNAAWMTRYPTRNPNVLLARSLNIYYEHLNLGKPTQHDEFRMSPLTVTAWYTANHNEIGFPAAFLQPPVPFDPSVPSYLSYGALGSVIGHELTHGFDPSGSQYDYDGRLRNWWSNSTREAFAHKSNCFVYQYSNYTIPKSHGKYRVNGSLTLSENVVDAGGVHAAFWAWRRREERSFATLLRVLEYFTKDQLFIVSYGRFWCSNGDSEELYRKMLINAHAPEDVRLLGTMENSREFKQAFGCTESKPQSIGAQPWFSPAVRHRR
ncbi:hypothetical protein B7463_g4631, partial [Scytalidium lignicola]